MLLFSEMYCYFCVDLTSGASRGGGLEVRESGVLVFARRFPGFCRIQNLFSTKKRSWGFKERSGARLIHVSDETSTFSVPALLLSHLKFALNGARVYNNPGAN